MIKATNKVLNFAIVFFQKHCALPKTRNNSEAVVNKKNSENFENCLASIVRATFPQQFFLSFYNRCSLPLLTYRYIELFSFFLDFFIFFSNLRGEYCRKIKQKRIQFEEKWKNREKTINSKVKIFIYFLYLLLHSFSLHLFTFLYFFSLRLC